VAREKLSPQQWARLEAGLRKGPLAYGFAHDQRWTLGRVKTLTGRLCHVGYTVEGTSRLLRRHGWPARVPVRPVSQRVFHCSGPGLPGGTSTPAARARHVDSRRW
jgi:hypothetical protein